MKLRVAVLLTLCFALLLYNTASAFDINGSLVLRYWIVDNNTPVAGTPLPWADTVIDAPAFLRINNSTIYLYVEGYAGGSTGENLGVLVSYDDGLTWHWLASPIPDFAGSQSWNSNGDECCPTPFIYDGKIFLIYCSHPPTAWYFNLGLAVSDDGVNFTTVTNASPIVNFGTWDSTSIFHPTKPEYFNGTWYLYYTGRTSDGTFGIGLLVSNSTEFPYKWHRVTANSPLWWTGNREGRPKIIKIGSTYYMVYKSGDGKLWLRYSNNLGNWSDPLPIYGVDGIEEMDVINTSHWFIAAGVSETRWTTHGVGILKAAIINTTPYHLNVKAYLNESKTFSVRFVEPLNYSWYYDGKLISNGTGINPRINISFNEIGKHVVSLLFREMWLNWTVTVIPTPKIRVTVNYPKECEVFKPITFIVNATNVSQYFVKVKVNGEVHTFNCNRFTLTFSRPDTYNITVNVTDLATGFSNVTYFTVHVYSHRIYLGVNKVLKSGLTCFANTSFPAHVSIKPINVSSNFTMIVNYENVNASEGEILNVTFLGLHTSDRIWLNESVLNASKVDIYHNGEPYLLGVPVYNNSVNVTLYEFSTYVIVANSTKPKNASSFLAVTVTLPAPTPTPTPTPTPAQNTTAVIVAVVIAISIIILTIKIASKIKNKATSKVFDGYRFFKKL